MTKAIFCVLAALLFFSCDDNTGNGTISTGAPEVLDAAYTLQEVRVTGNGTDVTLSPPAATGTAVVTSDGRITTTVSIPSQSFEETFSGTYSVSGNTLTLNWDDGTVEQWTISADRNQVLGAGTSEGFTLTQTWVRV